MPFDFSPAHAALQAHVAAQRLPGVSAVVTLNGEVVDEFCTGFADLEARVPLRPDHIHRAFSNTKLLTSLLLLRLVDERRLGLDDPVSRWLPGFASTRVLRPGATTLNDTEELQRPLTLRDLLSHQAGLSHALFDPGSLLFEAYVARGVRRPDTTLATSAEVLPTLPLNRQPGTAWEYSMAPDLLGRVAEIVTGQTFASALQERLLDPLGLGDTGFVLRPEQVVRLAALYGGDAMDPMKPGLERLDSLPWPCAYVAPVPRQSAAGGLFTTQADMLAVLHQLLPGRGTLLQPATLAELMRDQLPSTANVNFPHTGALPGLGFGLAGAVTRAPWALEPATPVGEVQWGGLAGTHWAVAPAQGVAIVLMTQRYMGFWNPFWFDYKALVYAALR